MTAGIDFQSSTDRLGAWLDADGSTLRIEFRNPERLNALSVDMWEALPGLIAAGESHPDVRLIVFSGMGRKAFVSGADISQFEKMRSAADAVARYEVLAEQSLQCIQGCRKPTLALIRGYCLGSGINVALCCDLRVASADAVFGIPAARLGLGYRFSALRNLVQLVGPGVAKDLLFTARRIDANEAWRIGLVSRVVAGEELDDALRDYQATFAANAPITIGAAKAVIAEILKPTSEIDREMCDRLVKDCYASEDYADGRRAFMEKRAPVFTGK